MSQKRSTILVWAAVIFAFLIVCLITGKIGKNGGRKEYAHE